MSNETKGPQPAGEVRMYSGLLYALLDGDFPVGTKLYVHPPPSAPEAQGGGELPSPLNGDFDCPKAAAARSCPCGFCRALRTPSAPVGVDANELTGVRARLKSGDYDGADVMRAWLAIDKLLALAQQPASSAPDPAAGDAVAMQPVAEVAMSDDGYKIGLLGPLRAHRLPLGTKLYASPRAAISGANAPVEVECNCPGAGKADPKLHAPNCPKRHAQQPAAVDEAAEHIAALRELYATRNPVGRFARAIKAGIAALAQQPAAVDEVCAHCVDGIVPMTLDRPCAYCHGVGTAPSPEAPTMTADVEPLPRYGFPDGTEPRPVPCVDGYWTPWHLARACVAHATAPLQAEIEALRVDVEAWKASHSMLTDTCHHFQARAKRLAEALREVQPFIGWTGSYPELHAKIDALLRGQEDGK